MRRDLVLSFGFFIFSPKWLSYTLQSDAICTMVTAKFSPLLLSMLLGTISGEVLLWEHLGVEELFVSKAPKDTRLNQEAQEPKP